jgi:hypothetical protein
VHIQDRYRKYGFVAEFNSNFDADQHLYFPFHLPSTGSNTRHLLSLQYLHTYLNAGSVDVEICGIIVTRVDALLVDFQTNFVSITNSHKAVIPFDLKDACTETNSFIEIIHRNLAKDEAFDKNSRIAQKFKLESIKLCVLE